MPHLDYGDVIFDKTYKFFHQRLEFVQYKTSLAITGAINKDSSTEKLYYGLSLFRRDDGFEIKQSQKYLYDLIPSDKK